MEEVTPLLWCYGDKMFFSVLKLLKWLAKFKEWKYRSQVTNCMKKMAEIFLQMYKITKQINMLKKMHRTILLFLPKLFPRLNLGAMYYWAEMNMLKDRLFCPSTKKLQWGPSFFLPVPQSGYQLWPEELVSSNKALWLLWHPKSLVLSRHPKQIHLGCSGPICAWHEMNTAIS